MALNRKTSWLFVIFSICLLLGAYEAPFVSAQTENAVSHYDLIVRTEDPYYLRGETAEIHVESNPSTSYNITIYDSLMQPVWQRNRSTNSAGKDQISFSVPLSSSSGTYTIVANTLYITSKTWVTILETIGYTPQSFPYETSHHGVNMSIRARGFTATNGDGNISITYPSLPINFTVNSFSNNMSLVERLRNNALGIKIDFSYLFIHSGIKIRINGTVPQPTTYSFEFVSPRTLKRKLDALSDGWLVFDWSDLRKATQQFSYNQETRMLTVNIPKSFVIDPVIFMDGFESGDFSGWDGTSGSPTVVTSPTHHGTYAMQSNFTGNWQTIYAYDDSAISETPVFVRWYTRFDTLPGAGESFALLQTRDTALSSIFKLGINETGGSYYLWLDYYGTTNSTYMYEYAFQANTWYGLKTKYVQDGSNGEVRVWLDGSEVITDTEMNTTSHTFRRVLLGFDSGTSGSFIIWSDCVVIDNSDIDFEAAPTIGEFAAPSTVYANQYFFLNTTIQSITDRTNQSFVNATIQISNSVTLQWLNSTNVFSVNSDPSSYVTLDAATSTKTSVNSTSHKLSWYIKLNNYPAGSIDVIVTNTKVFDDGDFSGSGSETGLFTFSYITLTLQARDADGTNLPKTVSYSGTYGNATTLSSTNSDSSGLLALTTCYGSHTITTQWGTHTIDSRSISVTADATENIDTKVQRLDSGSNYLLFSLDNTDLVTPELIGTYDWRMESVTASGSIEFKMDNANWIKTGVPYSFTTGSQTWTSGIGSWSFSSNIFTFTVDFSTQTLSMIWDAPEAPPSGGGGGGGGVPEEPIIPLPIPEEPVVPVQPVPVIPIEAVEPALLAPGVILIIGSIVAVIGYGEFRRRNPSARKAFKNRAKHKKIKWPKKPQKKVDWKKKR